MSKFNPKGLCMLGRQPALGMAELESLYGAEHIQPIQGAALLDIEAGDIDFKRLGGTIKVARVLAILPTTNWPELSKYLIEQIPLRIQHVPEGKFTLGVSVYNLSVSADAINRSLLAVKKIVKATGRPVRVVPNKLPELNSAQVLHNKLTTIGAWELLLVGNGDKTILAQTMFVQDIEGYAARDQARPKRDARVGMLPPKLAQIIINLATDPDDKFVVLDPFCGTGVILQEAMLMGFDVIGADLEERLVDYSKTNIDWLRSKSSRELPEASFEVGDATNHKWSAPFGCLASEVYLGRAFTAPPPMPVLETNIRDVDTIIKKFLKNLHGQIPPGFRLCIALPAWRPKDEISHLPLLDHLTDMGYNRIAFQHAGFDDLIYAREGQIVARELVVLKRL